MTAPAFKAAGTVANATTAGCSPPWPAGHAIGDVALIVAESADTSSPATPTLSTAAGFTLLTDVIDASGLTRLTVWWNRATSTTQATPTIAAKATRDHITARILTFSGCLDTGDPTGALATDSDSTAGTTRTAPSITTTQDESLVVVLVSRDNDSSSSTAFSGWTNANLTGFAEITDFGSAGGNGGGIGAAAGSKDTAGAVGTSTVTTAAAVASSYVTVALKRLLTATANDTLGSVTLAATATDPVQGTLSATPGAVTAAGTATDPVAATANLTPDAVTAAGVATDPVVATAGVMPGDVTAAGVATDPVRAQLDATLDPVGVGATATDPAQATLGATLDGVGLDAHATVGDGSVHATLNETLGDVAADAQASVVVDAALDATVGDVTGQGTGTAPVQAQLDATLDAVTVAASATAHDQVVSPIQPVRVVRPGGRIQTAPRRGASLTTAARDGGALRQALRAGNRVMQTLRPQQRGSVVTPQGPVLLPLLDAQLSATLDATALDAAATVVTPPPPREATLSSTLAAVTAAGAAIVLDPLPPLSATLAAALSSVDIAAHTGVYSSLSAQVDAQIGSVGTNAHAQLGAVVVHVATLAKAISAVQLNAAAPLPLSATATRTLGAFKLASVVGSGRTHGATVHTIDASFGDGVKDATTTIQTAIDTLPSDGGVIVLPAGTYLIDTDRLKPGGIKLRNNLRFEFRDGAWLKAKPTTSPRAYVMLVQSVSSVEVVGAGIGRCGIIGNRSTYVPQPGTTSEWNHGCAVYGPHGVTFQDFTVKDCGGDGFSVGGKNGIGATDVVFRRIESDGNRRQGISFVWCDGFKIEDCLLTDTVGTSPECGIDCEPELGNWVKNGTITGGRISGNHKYAILLLHRSGVGYVDNILIDNVEVTAQVSNGIVLDSVTETNQVSNITVTNCKVHDNFRTGIKATDAMPLSIAGCDFHGNYQSGTRTFRTITGLSRPFTDPDLLLTGTSAAADVGTNTFH
jgi:hypothetical protein